MKDSKMNFEELSFEEKVGTEGGVIPVVVIGAAKYLHLQQQVQQQRQLQDLPHMVWFV